MNKLHNSMGRALRGRVTGSLAGVGAAACLAASPLTLAAEDKNLLLIAGPDSHGPRAHEHEAGMKLFAESLEGVEGLTVTVVAGGWPEDEGLIAQADAVVFYADGFGGHPAIQGERMALLQERIDQGMSIGMVHFAVHVPAERGGAEFQNWIGGYYEDGFSVNPMWTAEIRPHSSHPITRGVGEFSVHDEWYFNMRFRENMEGVTPVLVATPSDETRDGPYVHPPGPYPHIQAEKGREEVLMWAVERPDGGRGFGFTGGHFHSNWHVPEKRRVVLNAMLWLAGIEVPENGVPFEVDPEAEIGR